MMFHSGGGEDSKMRVHSFKHAMSELLTKYAESIAEAEVRKYCAISELSVKFYPSKLRSNEETEFRKKRSHVTQYYIQTFYVISELNWVLLWRSKGSEIQRNNPISFFEQRIERFLYEQV